MLKNEKRHLLFGLERNIQTVQWLANMLKWRNVSEWRITAPDLVGKWNWKMIILSFENEISRIKERLQTCSFLSRQTSNSISRRGNSSDKRSSSNLLPMRLNVRSTNFSLLTMIARPRGWLVIAAICGRHLKRKKSIELYYYIQGKTATLRFWTRREVKNPNKKKKVQTSKKQNQDKKVSIARYTEVSCKITNIQNNRSVFVDARWKYQRNVGFRFYDRTKYRKSGAIRSVLLRMFTVVLLTRFTVKQI